VHTSEWLRPAHFAFARPGDAAPHPGGLGFLLPAFDPAEVVGIVSPHPVDGILGAGCAVLACVTAFYEARRERGETASAYPPHVVLLGRAAPRAGTWRAPREKLVEAWGELDVWPASQWVDAGESAAELLGAARARGVTRLFWPDWLAGPAGDGGLRSLVRYDAGAPSVESRADPSVADMIRKSLVRTAGAEALPVPRAEAYRTTGELFSTR